MTISLQFIPPIWETFITTIINSNRISTFDKLVRQCTQEENMIISRGIIQKHEEGEPSTFVTQDNRKKGKGRPSNSRIFSPKLKYSNRILRKYKPQVECFNCHKYGHYGQLFEKERCSNIQ